MPPDADVNRAASPNTDCKADDRRSSIPIIVEQQRRSSETAAEDTTPWKLSVIHKSSISSIDPLIGLYINQSQQRDQHCQLIANDIQYHLCETAKPRLLIGTYQS